MGPANLKKITWNLYYTANMFLIHIKSGSIIWNEKKYSIPDRDEESG